MWSVKGPVAPRPQFLYSKQASREKRQVCQCGATVAQLICNQWVAGSIPVTGSMSFRRSEVLYPLILPSHATNMQQLNLKVHLCVLCDRCSLSINACNEAGKAKLTVAVSIRVLGFVPPTGIGWKVTKALRAPTLLLERSRACTALFPVAHGYYYSLDSIRREKVQEATRNFSLFVSKAIERTHDD